MANTIREKELKTSWDALTASDSAKAAGHQKSLIAEEESHIPERKLKGIR
jgi:hypothetical protein